VAGAHAEKPREAARQKRKNHNLGLARRDLLDMAVGTDGFGAIFYDRSPSYDCALHGVGCAVIRVFHGVSQGR